MLQRMMKNDTCTVMNKCIILMYTDIVIVWCLAKSIPLYTVNTVNMHSPPYLVKICAALRK